MSKPYNPRAPRPNPEIADIRRSIARTWHEFEHCRSYLEMQGHAAVLQAYLQMVLAEPEFIYDLVPVSPGSQRHWPSLPELNGVVLRDPFEPLPLGDVHANYRFCAIPGGSITPLFPIEALPTVGMATLSIYAVQVMEPIFLSVGSTGMRLTSETALRRCVQQRPPKPGSDYLLFIDPLGWTGQAMAVNHYVQSAAAARAAQRLTDWLEIRFLVARILDVIHTH